MDKNPAFRGLALGSLAWIVFACGQSSPSANGAGGAGASASSSSGSGGAGASSSTSTSSSSTSTSSSSTSASSTSSSSTSGSCTPVDGNGVFTAPNVWTKDISCEPVDPSSQAILSTLAQAGGWGTGLTKFQIDMSLVVLHADASTPFKPFTKAAGYPLPDCDDISTLPLPAVGAIEGSAGYTCDVANNDCHYLVVHPPSNKLYEVYQATQQGGGLVGGCAVVWDLGKTYPDNLRGDQCTSTDAAGFPPSAMLPDADEVAAGAVNHAIRFALPNSRIRAGVYVHPATHAGGPSGGVNFPPYGVRLRLRADYPLANLPSDAARVLAKALQRFGMFMSDGGNVPLMVQSDQFTTHKWVDLNLDSHALYGIAPTDFEIVDMGPTVPLTYDCVRNP